VPVKLGAGGIEDIIQLDLSEEEREDLEYSANDVRNMVEVLHS
jgi:malate dehydrogenase